MAVEIWASNTKFTHFTKPHLHTCRIVKTNIVYFICLTFSYIFSMGRQLFTCLFVCFFKLKLHRIMCMTKRMIKNTTHYCYYCTCISIHRCRICLHCYYYRIICIHVSMSKNNQDKTAKALVAVGIVPDYLWAELCCISKATFSTKQKSTSLQQYKKKLHSSCGTDDLPSSYLFILLFKRCKRFFS